jgi:hypothetical protein
MTEAILLFQTIPGIPDYIFRGNGVSEVQTVHTLVKNASMLLMSLALITGFLMDYFGFLSKWNVTLTTFLGRIIKVAILFIGFQAFFALPLMVGVGVAEGIDSYWNVIAYSPGFADGHTPTSSPTPASSPAPTSSPTPGGTITRQNWISWIAGLAFSAATGTLVQGFMVLCYILFAIVSLVICALWLMMAMILYIIGPLAIVMGLIPNYGEKLFHHYWASLIQCALWPVWLAICHKLISSAFFDTAVMRNTIGVTSGTSNPMGFTEASLNDVRMTAYVVVFMLLYGMTPFVINYIFPLSTFGGVVTSAASKIGEVAKFAAGAAIGAVTGGTGAAAILGKEAIRGAAFARGLADMTASKTGKMAAEKGSSAVKSAATGAGKQTAKKADLSAVAGNTNKTSAAKGDMPDFLGNLNQAKEASGAVHNAAEGANQVSVGASFSNGGRGDLSSNKTGSTGAVTGKGHTTGANSFGGNRNSIVSSDTSITDSSSVKTGGSHDFSASSRQSLNMTGSRDVASNSRESNTSTSANSQASRNNQTNVSDVSRANNANISSTQSGSVSQQTSLSQGSSVSQQTSASQTTSSAQQNAVNNSNAVNRQNAVTSQDNLSSSTNASRSHNLAQNSGTTQSSSISQSNSLSSQGSHSQGHSSSTTANSSQSSSLSNAADRSISSSDNISSQRSTGINHQSNITSGGSINSGHLAGSSAPQHQNTSNQSPAVTNHSQAGLGSHQSSLLNSTDNSTLGAPPSQGTLNMPHASGMDTVLNHGETLPPVQPPAIDSSGFIPGPGDFEKMTNSSAGAADHAPSAPQTYESFISDLPLDENFSSSTQQPAFSHTEQPPINSAPSFDTPENTYQPPVEHFSGSSHNLFDQPAIPMPAETLPPPVTEVFVDNNINANVFEQPSLAPNYIDLPPISESPENFSISDSLTEPLSNQGKAKIEEVKEEKMDKNEINSIVDNLFND